MNETMTLPEILKVPEKLLPVIPGINKYRYFLLEGGRASGKSQFIARFILYLCSMDSLRVVCGRETQNTIEESVYTIFVDLIRSYNLDFEVLSSKLINRKTGSEIRFRGFREQGSINIKGLEGTSILWVDEAQAISKQTLDIIIPTIRKEKSKVFWSMNRKVEGDPVFAFFINRDDCLHVHIDYLDNPFCPEAMRIEAEKCKYASMEDYQHIWRGDPLLKSEDHLFGMDMLRDSAALDMNRIGVSRGIGAADVARFGDCETVFSILKSHGPVMWEHHYMEPKKHIGGSEIVGRAFGLQKEFGLDALVFDADGGGGYLSDFMPEVRGFEVMEFYCLKDWKDDPQAELYGDRRTAAYFKVQDWINKGWLKILPDQVLFEQLLSIQYHYDGRNRKILFSKDEMRKKQVPSPDRADSLAMAVYYADALMTERFQNVEYAPMETQLVAAPSFHFDVTHPESAFQ